MLKVVELRKTCDADPAQWEGKLDDDRQIYIRYRDGCLTMRVSIRPTWDVMKAVRQDPFFSRLLGEGGHMNDHELTKIVEGTLELPMGFKPAMARDKPSQ